MVYRFPQVPTNRLIGFPYLPEGLSITGCLFYLLERGPLGRWDLIWLASLIRPKSASRLAISWLHQRTRQLESVSWLPEATD